jgi:hypothetical protein
VSRLRSWVRRTPAERRSLLVAAMTVSGVRVLLWVLPYRVVSWLVHQTAMPARGGPPESPATAERIARDVASVARVVPRATCLVQALAGEWLIVRAGAPVALQFGVAFGERGLEAHAWLESGDRIILGAEEAARFSAMRAP